MSDIVDELEYHAREYPELIHGPLCGKAAAEIKRLQDALSFEQQNAFLDKEKLQAEIERLRTALERIRFVEGISRSVEKLALDALRQTGTGEER